MQDFDFCAKMVFAPSDYREKLNKKINSLFSHIRQEVHKRGIKANMYLSGSLSRQEPSIGINSIGDVYMCSDFDFLLFPAKEFIQDPFLLDLEPWLLTNFPEFKSTVFMVDPNKIDDIRSCTRRDLEASWHNPVFATLTLPDLQPKRISAYELFESMNRQIFGYFLHPDRTQKDTTLTRFRASETYHYLKLVLECLCSQFIVPEEGVQGYYSLFIRRYDERLSFLLAPDQIAAFIKARELFGVTMIPQVDLIQLIEKSLFLHFNLDAKTNTSEELFYSIQERALQTRQFIHDFQYIVLCFVLSQQGKLSQSYFRLMETLLLRMDCKQLRRSSSSDIQELIMLTHNTVALRIEQQNRMIDLLREVSEDYLYALIKRNMPAPLESLFA